MFMACRHIKANGLRCKSPALEGKNFCYFHSKFHTRVTGFMANYADLDLPLPEDSAAIMLSIARISAAILHRTLDPKRAGQLLFGLQIASQHIDRKKPFDEADTVSSVSQSEDGDELAPELRICGKDERCEKCPHAKDCPNYHEYVDDPNDPDAQLRMLMSFGRHLDDRFPETSDQEEDEDQDQDQNQEAGEELTT